MASVEIQRQQELEKKRTESFIASFIQPAEVRPSVIHGYHLLLAEIASDGQLTPSDHLKILDQDERWYIDKGWPVPNQSQIDKYRAFWTASL